MGNAGLLKRGDPSTKFVELNQPYEKKATIFSVFCDLETTLRSNSDVDTLLVFYYNGESHLASGKIRVNLG